MRFDIRTAALDELLEKRVNLAVSLLKAYRISATATPWDGTRCQLLIAAGDDAYGRQALALARKRGVATIEFRADETRLHADAFNADLSAAQLVKHILERLPKSHSDDLDVGADLEAPLPSLCRLAQAPLRGKAIVGIRGGRRIVLRPQLGRVYAATWSDLLAGADALCETDWDLSPSRADEDCRHLISSSIESFLVRAAYRASDRLPDYPDGCYRLKVWPDLGSLPSLVGALKIARQLIGNARNLRDFQAALMGIDKREVNACLWAFAAADLLQNAVGADRAIATSPAPANREGIWSSLARKFGLLRA